MLKPIIFKGVALFLIVIFSFIGVLYKRFWRVDRLKSLPNLHSSSKLVIGFSLPRTGTSSLTQALNNLGFTSHHFPLHFDDPFIRTQYLNKVNAFLDWTTLGKRPKELFELFPNAYFVHTCRSFKEWMKSMKKLRNILFLSPRIRRQFLEEYGPERKWKAFYDDFEQEIQDIKLLTNKVYDVDITKTKTMDGLCSFLNVPLVNPNRFPHKREIILQIEQIFNI